MIHPTQIYVAAASDPAERERAKVWTRQLVGAGLTITSTWIETIENHQNGVGNPRDAEWALRNELACRNQENVARADLLWFLVPRDFGKPTVSARGGYYEAGIARALKKVLVFSGDTKQSIFGSHATEFEEDLDAFAAICRMAREGIYS